MFAFAISYIFVVSSALILNEIFRRIKIAKDEMAYPCYCFKDIKSKKIENFEWKLVCLGIYSFCSYTIALIITLLINFL